MESVQTTSVYCGKCRDFLIVERLNTPDWTTCDACGASLLAVAFPALIRPFETSRADILLEEGEASCFYHPQKKAATACNHCGRFLCALCDVDFNGQHYCPQCLDAGKKKGRMKNLENYRLLYDRIAFLLAFAPILVWPLSFITAPIALYISIRYWNAPLSIIPQTRVRFVLAIIFSLGTISAWVVVLYFFLTRLSVGS